MKFSRQFSKQDNPKSKKKSAKQNQKSSKVLRERSRDRKADRNNKVNNGNQSQRNNKARQYQNHTHQGNFLEGGNTDSSGYNSKQYEKNSFGKNKSFQDNQSNVNPYWSNKGQSEAHKLNKFMDNLNSYTMNNPVSSNLVLTNNAPLFNLRNMERKNKSNSGRNQSRGKKNKQ
jgi:hypothetical protein